jgi:type II restriction enzyme
VLMAVPALVVRNDINSTRFEILVDYKKKKLVYEEYDFSKNAPTAEDIEKYLTFIKETGLRDLLASKKLKNLVDYMIGVEAGLDSNGRKNRGGHAMENIVEVFVADACQKLGLRYLKEAD